jgi:hypothetical protein
MSFGGSLLRQAMAERFSQVQFRNPFIGATVAFISIGRKVADTKKN